MLSKFCVSMTVCDPGASDTMYMHTVDMYTVSQKSVLNYTVCIISITAASELHKLSKSEVVEKVIPVANVVCLPMTCANNSGNWWLCIDVIASQTWNILGHFLRHTVCVK